MTTKNCFQIIKYYPCFWPKIYVFCRSLILPIDQIESLLPDKGSILDVGCGYGLTTAFFALNKHRQMLGLEINSKKISLAQKIFSTFPNISFETADLLSTQKKSFNSILAIDLLHHLNPSQKDQFLKDAFQKLENSGTLIIKEINTKPLLKYLWNYFHDLIMTKFSSLHFLSTLELKKLLNKHHFKIIKKGMYKNFLYPHTFYVCQKNS